MSIRCVKYRAFERNTLKAFVDLELSRVGIIVRECAWHRHPDGKEWIGLPAKPYEKNGERSWLPIVEFVEGNKEARRQFQAKALEAVHSAAAGRDDDLEELLTSKNNR